MSLKFAADPEGYSPGHEYELMIESLEKLYRLFPNVMVCESNHTSRIFKKAIATGIPRVYLRALHDFMKAPKGWEWKIVWEVEKVLYMHGDSFNGSSWMRAHNIHRQSVVIGHLHSRAGVVYSNTPYSRVFSMNTGCLINPEAYAFNYAKLSPEKACLGAGIVINGREAYWIPMPEQHGHLNKIAAGKLRP